MGCGQVEEATTPQVDQGKVELPTTLPGSYRRYQNLTEDRDHEWEHGQQRKAKRPKDSIAADACAGCPNQKPKRNPPTGSY